MAGYQFMSAPLDETLLEGMAGKRVDCPKAPGSKKWCS
jgi:hypothetical protein